MNTKSKSKPLSVEEIDNKKLNSQTIKRKDIKDTPFTIITIDGKSFGTMGMYKITEDYDKEIKVENELEKVNWNRIVQVLMILMEHDRNKKLKD